MDVQTIDICECGDYRHQHEDGWKRCKTCTDPDPMNGRPCLMFRLHQTAQVRWRRFR